MGFIGYLPSDDILFSIANKLLKPGGKLIVSCRNRLFNVFSGSKYLPLEIENDFADSLVQEANRLFHQVPAGLAEKFLISLKETSSHILETDFGKSNKNEHTDPEFKSEIEAKQHTPEQIKHVAESNGFTIKNYYGIHPHIFSPKMNSLLPPQVFNKLSDCLCVFEDQPISLTWSSVFIAVCEKK
jgi:SAM-dependent methyltransferase